MELKSFLCSHSLPGNVSCPFQAVFLNFHHINKGKIFFLLYPVIKPDNLGKVSNHYEMEEDSYSLSSHTKSFYQDLKRKLVILCNIVLFLSLRVYLAVLGLTAILTEKSQKSPKPQQQEDPSLHPPRKTHMLWTAA